MSDERSEAMPDEFDSKFRRIGALDGVSKTAKATITVVPSLGVGWTRTFIIRTMRHEGSDHLFVEMRVVEAKDFGDAVTKWRDHLLDWLTAEGCFEEDDRNTQPESVAVLSDEPVIR